MPKSQKLTRVYLVSGHTNLDCYVDDHPHLKIGVDITLADDEDPKRLWTVKAMYETVERYSIKQGWNNNI